MNKSWAATLTPLAGLMAAMIGKAHPALAELITTEMIMGLLAMLGITGGYGILAKKDKTKTEIAKEKIALEREQLEVEKKKLDEPIKKTEKEIKQAVEKAMIRSVNELKRNEWLQTRPENYAKLTEVQKDDFLNQGGVVNPHMKETEGIRWNHMSDFIDHTLDHDEELGAVMKYGEQFLYVKVKDAVSGHTLQLFNEKGNLLQIDQKPQNKVSCITMKGYDKQPYPKGKYKLVITAMQRGTSYAQGFTTEFEIV